MANTKIKELSFLDGIATITGNVGLPTKHTVDKKTTQKNIWVSSDGLDTNDGTMLSPYLTIAKAFENVSSTKNRVLVFPGRYEITEALVFPTITTELCGIGGAESVEIKASPFSSSFADNLVEMPVSVTYADTTIEHVVRNIYFNMGYTETTYYAIHITNAAGKEQMWIRFFGCAVNSKTNNVSVQITNNPVSGTPWQKVEWFGYGSRIEGQVNVTFADASDYLKIHDCELRDGVYAWGDVAARLELHQCTVKPLYAIVCDSATSILASLLGCYSEDGNNIHAAVTEATSINGSTAGASVNPAAVT